MPSAVVGIMLWDLDPVTFLVVQFLKSHPEVESMVMNLVSGYDVAYLAVRFWIIYILNLMLFYEVMRLSLLFVLGPVFVFTKITFLQRTAILFQPSASNLRIQLLWIKWANRLTILFKVVEPFMNQIILVALCFVGSAMITNAFILIRLHGSLDPIVALFSFVGVFTVGLISKVSWELLADIHADTEMVINKFKGLKASLPTNWERKWYERVVKAIRPIGVVFSTGVGNTTFLIAGKSSKLASIKILAEQTVNVLLIDK